MALQVSRRKIYGLLAFLAFSKRQYSRDRLSDLFWPAQDEKRSRGSLRVLLSEIHKIMPPEILPVSNEMIGPLDLRAVSVDTETFQELITLVRHNMHSADKNEKSGKQADEDFLLKAISLYRGDFLSGFSLKNCLQFSDWQLQQCEFLNRELCFALESLVAIYEKKADFEKGIHYCRKYVEQDYLNEEAHCTMMRLYAASGQRNLAVNQFQLCKKALIEELNLRPEESTFELYESILHSRPVRKKSENIASPVRPRIAVLPFKNLTHEQEWFSDAMTDALITELSGKNTLEVISYNSSRYFKDTERSVRQVASELRAHYLLDGSVVKSGDEIRISARLIEAAGERNVWGESYHGSFSNLLALQGKIAGMITGCVTGEIIGNPENELEADVKTEAKEACLMGDFYLRKSESDEEIDKARGFYQKAAEIDSSCAEAYAGLAFTYFSIAGNGRDLLPTEEEKERVRFYTGKALKLDPRNCRARMILAGSHWEWDFNFSAAEKEFDEVLRINPNNIEALCWFAELKMLLGKIDEMGDLVQKAYSLNPIDFLSLDHMFRYHIMTLQYRRCFEIIDRIEELYPGHSSTSFMYALMFIRNGQYDKAVGHIEKALSIIPEFDAYRNVLSLAYAGAGRNQEASGILSGMMKDRENGKNIRAFDISLSCHAVGRDEEALNWLEVSHREDKMYTFNALFIPSFGELHWDSRFQNIFSDDGVPMQLEYIRKALDLQKAGEASS